MTGIDEIDHASATSAAPEHVWVSVVGGRTQVDVTLPVDVAVASLLPELVKLVRSRDVEVSTDATWGATRDTFWVLSRLDPLVPLQPNQTLRDAGVIDGELLQLADERAQPVPTLYDDVVDAAARLNKAAYAGWSAAAALWMSFAGLAAASLVWVYLVVNVTAGTQRALIVGLAAVVALTMIGVATLAHRSFGRADIGAAAGWSTIPITAALVWALVRGFGDYGVATGCAVLAVLNAAFYRAIGAGRWGYVASGVIFIGSGLAMLSHAFAVPAQTVGVVLAVVGAFVCLTVSKLTGRVAWVEPSTRTPDRDREAAVFEAFATPQPSTIDSGAESPSLAVMPTAEAVWERARAAAVTGSAVYAGLALYVVCGAVTVLRAEPEVRWAALVFAALCVVVLGLHARVPETVLERFPLFSSAVALTVVGCISAQNGDAAMAWTGYGTLLAIAVAAMVTGLRMSDGNRFNRWAAVWAYLQYAAYAALIPVALWVTDVYARLEIR